MSSWKHLAIISVFGGGAVALTATAIFLLWSGHVARAEKRPGGGLVVTRSGVSVPNPREVPDAEGFVITLNVRNDADNDIKLTRKARIMGRASDTGAIYVVNEAELADSYLIPSRQPATLQIFLHMKCADEPDWKKCFQSVYGNVEAFEIVDTVVNLPKPNPTD